MRFKRPQSGDIRTRKGFLFFPKTIDNETRWLEKATWTQFCEVWEDVFLFGTVREWKDFAWINKPTQDKGE